MAAFHLGIKTNISQPFHKTTSVILNLTKISLRMSVNQSRQDHNDRPVEAGVCRRCIDYWNDFYN